MSNSERTFSSLANPVFRVIWAAATFSHFGGVIQITAAAWLMTSLTTSTALIAMVQTAAALPVMFLALLAGATADIYDKRAQMIFAAGFCALSVFLLVVLYETNLLGPWSLLILIAMLGISGAFYSPAWQASLPEIVSRTHFVSAISVNNLSMNVARCLGPAIAAETLVRLGASIAFIINGVSFVLLVCALLLWKRDKSDRTLPRESIFSAIRDGVRYAVISPAMRATLARGFSFAFFASALLALPPVIALELQGTARTLGYLLVGFGAGATTGALMVTWMRARASVDRISLISSLFIGLSLVILGLSDALWMSTASLVLGGFFWVQIVSIIQISIQTSCPRWVAGRMVSMLAMAFSAGIASGSVTWGLVADASTVSAALFIAAATSVIGGLLMCFLPFSPPPASDLEPHSMEVVENAPDLNLKAGPIILEVEYRVSKDNVKSFMQAIFELRQVRIRDGGRRWSLSQSIEDNAVWIEQFQSPTWADYLHRASRRVVGDIAIQDAVLAACEKTPIWRRRLERSAHAEPLDMAWPDQS